MRRTALVITSAGVSSRFSRSLGREAVKCLYTETTPEDTILARQVAVARKLGLSPIVLVGGYRYPEVVEFCAQHLAGAGVELVENKEYATTGTLYSLHLGLSSLLGRKDLDLDGIVFAEGDLFFDEVSFRAVAEGRRSVVSACPEPITAERSVALYLTLEGQVRYVYDPEHVKLVIPEPFRAIHNSGQVWRFHDLALLRALGARVGADRFDETNLGFIQEYFRTLAPEDLAVVAFETWFNCNTLADYRRGLSTLKGQR